MKLKLRRVGNSLGVIIPQSTLREWGVAETDSLELSAFGIRPARRMAVREELNEFKRALAIAVVSRFPANLIRAQGLANLHHWKEQDLWVSTNDEWKEILESCDDGALFAAMLGRDERSTRLRLSPPYVGLLPQEEVERLKEEASPPVRKLL